MTPKPTWITLYSITAMGVAALFMIPMLRPTPLMETALYVLVVSGLFGVMGLWIIANARALEAEDMPPMSPRLQYRLFGRVIPTAQPQPRRVPVRIVDDNTKDAA